MTPVEVLTNIREGRVDQRTLRHAVRLGRLVEVFGTFKVRRKGSEKPTDYVHVVEKISDYPRALQAQELVYRFTRRGESVLAQKT